MDNLKERRQKIKNLLPIRYFHEKAFDGNNRNPILKDIPIVGLNDSHVFKCGPILSKEQEFHLFRKYNYLKYRFHKLTNVNINRLGGKTLSELESLILKIENTRNIIFKCNTRLIVKPATKHFDQDTFNGDDFIANGFLHLMKAIDYFDYTRGFKFSTYCTWVLKHNMLRDKLKMHNIDNFENNNEEEDFNPQDRETYYDHANYEYNKSFVKKLLKDLEKRFPEKAKQKVLILKEVYGLDNKKPLLLREIGSKLKITRERVRQIKNEAIKMLKKTSMVYDPIA